MKYLDMLKGLEDFQIVAGLEGIDRPQPSLALFILSDTKGSYYGQLIHKVDTQH